MKKIFLTLIIVSNFLFGQTTSIYSNFGVGELNLNPTARRSGFGLGIAGSDNFDINPFNPASTTQIKFVKFAASLNYSYNNYSDQNSKNQIRNGSFENLLLAIPIQRDYGIVLSGGISPFTKVNYKVLSPTKYFDSIPYHIKYESIGGLTDYFIALSYELKEFGSLGFSTNFMIGTVINKISTEFNNTSIIDPSFTTETNYNGLAFRLAYISKNLSSYLDFLPVKDLKIGISYLNQTSLKSNKTELKQGIFIDTTGSESFETKLPAQFSVGLYTKFSDRLNLYVDYLNQNWTKLNTPTQTNFSTTNQHYVSIGFEYVPISRPEKYLDAITWRLGFFTKNIGIEINKQKINEYGFKAGFSLPIDQLNLLDFGLQYSIRGNRDNIFVKEKILNIWIGINFAEIWFVRNEE